MNKSMLWMVRISSWAGWNPRAAFNNVRALIPFLGEYVRFKAAMRRSPCPFPLGATYPCLGDRYAGAGAFEGHYFWQDLVVAQKIFRAAPKRHVDVGSRIDGFVAHVAAFREIEILDIRPVTPLIPNVHFTKADMMNLPSDWVEACDSLSCLHALEHFGLGRYGDPLDPEGHVKGFNTLEKMLQPGGTLYLSVPIGPRRVEFNAHRVFSLRYLEELFSGRFDVTSFSYINDQKQFYPDVALTDDVVRSNAGCHYGCGIFELRKRT